MLDLLPIGVCTLDADGAVQRYNRVASQLCGDGLRLYGRLRILCPDKTLMPFADTPLAETIRTGHPGQDIALLIERPDDEAAPVLANIQALRSDTGQITGAVVCFQGNTPARQGDADRRRSVEWLTAIVENTPECVKIVDQDGTLVQMNPAGLRMVGAETAADVEGQCVYDLIAPEHRAYWRDQHRRVCNGEKLSWEFDIISLGGTRRHMETHAVPLALPDAQSGASPGFTQLAVTRDITDRKRLEAANQEAERRLRELLDALPTAVYTTDANGKVAFFNQACVDLAGRTPAIGTDEWCVTWRLYWPDGTPLPHDACPMAVALKEQRPIHGAEAVAERPDGTRVPFLAYPAPLRNKAGTVIGAVNMLVDITERKVAEDHRQLLLNELNHRVKNTLAMLQSLARQTLRQTRDPVEFMDAFAGRLQAISEAHGLLSDHEWGLIRLSQLLQTQIDPYVTDYLNRIEIHKDEVRLGPDQAIGLALVIHELTTNARRYGSLSSPTGKVVITARVMVEEDQHVLNMTWSETGGPPVDAPRQKGFGTILIERSLDKVLGSSVHVEYLPNGLTAVIRLPLDQQSDEFFA